MACVEGPSSLLGQSAPGLLSGPCSSPDKRPKKRTCSSVSGSSALPGPLPLLVQPVKVLAAHFLPVEREPETQGLGQTLAPLCPVPESLHPVLRSGTSGSAECRPLATI